MTNIVPLSEIFKETLRKWPWILLSLAVCLALAVIYLLLTPPMYTETASLLLKDDSKGKSASASLDDFSDLGLFSANTNIQNEISTLQSPDLMEEVVRQLRLDWNFLTPGRFHKDVAYGESLPVNVGVAKFPEEGELSFKLTVNPDGSFVVKDMECTVAAGEKEADEDYKGMLGQPIATIAGQLTVSPSPFFVKGEEAIFYVSKIPLATATDDCEKRLSVSLGNDNSTVIDLAYTDRSILRADNVLNTLISVYNQNWINDKNQIAVSTSGFINDRLHVIEDELGNVDSDISAYKSEHLVPDVNAAAASYMAESHNLGNEILDVTNQLQMTRYIRSYLSSPGNADRALPANTGVNNLELQNQINQYNSKLLERNNLVEKSSDKNPLVRNLDSELAELRGAIIASVDNSVVALQGQLRSLQGAQGSATSKLASNPTQAKYLLSVERQQKVKESLYLFLLQKREDNELSQAFTAYNTRVIKRPGGTGRPTTPNKRNVLLVAFMLGILIPFGVVYVKETNNTKVRGRKDVENLSVPMLGEVPLFPARQRKKENIDPSKTIIVRKGSHTVINEAFRVLRTNVEFSKINKEGCNIMAITSFNAGSGKSFIVTNLAVSLAMKERRVLLIDGDFRRGAASGYFGSPKRGLADYLNGSGSEISSCLVNYPDFPSLSILPMGTTPPNPTELLEQTLFGQLLDTLRADYDYILIDCPPVEVVADTQIIDQYVDRTIFVLRTGLAERTLLPELEKIAKDKKYHHISFILNATPTASRYGSYGYYGYGSYGYGN